MTTALSLFDPLPLHSYDLVVVRTAMALRNFGVRGVPNYRAHVLPVRRIGRLLLVHFIGSTLAKSRSPSTDAMISTETRKA